MRSVLFLQERVVNSKRRFGQTEHYFPCTVVVGNKRVPALFTPDQVRTAMNRARENPEDCPPVRGGAWSRLCALIFGESHDKR